MIMRQLFEPISSTYTYLLACEETGQAILIDPVMPAWQRDLAVINSLELKLTMTVDTHIHADHITSARKLRDEAGSQIAHPAFDNLTCADIHLEEGTPLQIGGMTLSPIHTPGHTDGHHTYQLNERIFTGDTLLIDGCGRTDFQNGNADDLYHSVRDKLFALPDETLVYPGHDYQGRYVSSVAQEKQRNPRLGGDKTLSEFKEIMNNLNLAYPKFIDMAVPGNQQCGLCPPNVPEDLSQYCDEMEHSLQG